MLLSLSFSLHGLIYYNSDERGSWTKCLANSLLDWRTCHIGKLKERKSEDMLPYLLFLTRIQWLLQQFVPSNLVICCLVMHITRERYGQYFFSLCDLFKPHPTGTRRGIRTVFVIFWRKNRIHGRWIRKRFSPRNRRKTHSGVDTRFRKGRQDQHQKSNADQRIFV